MKIWKFNENWRAVCISVFHFPCKAESIRKKSRIVEASSYVFMQNTGLFVENCAGRYPCRVTPVETQFPAVFPPKRIPKYSFFDVAPFEPGATSF